MGTPRVHDLSQFGPELGGSHMPGSDGLRWSPATPRMSMSGAPSSETWSWGLWGRLNLLGVPSWV